MTQVTSRIGIIPTFGTYAYHPYLLARQIATLDQVSGGRIGWNVVTGSSPLAGMELRHGRLARARPALRHGRRVHAGMPGALGGVGHRRGYRRSRAGDPHRHRQGAALRVQGQVLPHSWPAERGACTAGSTGGLAQAGGSARGRRFAAKHAETIIAQVKTPEGMKEYRDDVRRHMVEHGREPDDCKVLFTMNPILGETMEDAEQRRERRLAWVRDNLQERLANISKTTNIDFEQFDLDQPLPDDVTTDGHQSVLDAYRKWAEGRSIREAMATFNQGLPDLVGTADSVAGQMAEIMQEVGGDGFLFSMPNVTRRSLAEIEDGLVPALQDRGLVRKAYEHAHLRDNLMSY